MDRDKDGLISYDDFKYTVGSNIQPTEKQYFRQERAPTETKAKEKVCAE